MIIQDLEQLTREGFEILKKLGLKGTKHHSDKIKFRDSYFVLKKFRSVKEAEKEANAYDTLRENTSLRLPKKYFLDREYILYEFVEESAECTPVEMVTDWQRVHSDNRLLGFFEYDAVNKEGVDWLVEKVVQHEDLYGENRNKYSEIIENGQDDLIAPKQICVVHGDLHLGNVIVNNGHRYYIDLESCSKKDPINDLVPTVLYHLESVDEVVKAYSDLSSIKVDEIYRRLKILSMFRGTKLIGYHNNRNIREEIKLRARKRILTALDSLL